MLAVLRRVRRLRPETLEGVSAKAAIFVTVIEADVWDHEDGVEYGLATVARDLVRLAKGGAA